MKRCSACGELAPARQGRAHFPWNGKRRRNSNGTMCHRVQSTACLGVPWASPGRRMRWSIGIRNVTGDQANDGNAESDDGNHDARPMHGDEKEAVG